jgi:hypothetical protein
MYKTAASVPRPRRPCLAKKKISSSFILPSSLCPSFSTVCRPQNVSATSRYGGFASSCTPPLPLSLASRKTFCPAIWDLLVLTARDIFQNATIGALHCPAWPSSRLTRDGDSSTFRVARGQLPVCLPVRPWGCGIWQGMMGRPTAAWRWLTSGENEGSNIGVSACISLTRPGLRGGCRRVGKDFDVEVHEGQCLQRVLIHMQRESW